MSSQIARFVADAHQGADRHGDVHDGLRRPAGSARHAVAGGQALACVGRRSPARGIVTRHVTAIDHQVDQTVGAAVHAARVLGAERSGECIDDSVQDVSPIRRQDGGQSSHAVGLRPHLDPPFGFGPPVTLGSRTRIGALYGTVDDRP